MSELSQVEDLAKQLRALEVELETYKRFVAGYIAWTDVRFKELETKASEYKDPHTI